LARHIVSPIKKLAQGIHALTLGNYQTQDYVPRKDEFGQLQQDQNKLARTLAKNEESRQQWLTNTSHELRTPLGIIKGELEAIQDGIRPCDEKNISSVLSEVDHLQKLIDDLHQINSLTSSAINLDLKPVKLNDFVRQQLETINGYLSKHDISITANLANSLADVKIDAIRLKQVFENLFQNSIEYAGAGTLITVSTNQELDSVILTIEDNGPGVDEEKLAHLFDYLYRVEQSRNRKLGGSGLGLAICKHIVEAHGGQINASKSSSGGLSINMRFPVNHD
jgi:two-component system sensor histidine kinase BaeS